MSEFKEEEITDYWIKKAKKYLLGRKIVEIRYTDKQEAEEMMWHKRSLVMILDNGTLVCPIMDDEINDGGALMVQENPMKDLDYDVLPVI